MENDTEIFNLHNITSSIYDIKENPVDGQINQSFVKEECLEIQKNDYLKMKIEEPKLQ